MNRIVKTEVKAWDSFKYLEVFDIISFYSTGEIKEVKSSGYFISKYDRDKLTQEQTATSLSASLYYNKEIIYLNIKQFD